MAKKSEKRKIIILRAAATIVTFAYLMWIFSNSLATAAISSAASGKVREAVQKCADFIAGEGKITVSEHFIRKAAHFSEFSLLGFLAYFTYFSYLFSKNKAVPICAFSAAATTLFCGAADECIQIFADGRGPSVFDAMIDFSGGICGVFVALVVFFLVKTAKNHSKKAQNTPENT